MTITLPTTACRRTDRASRLAHRRSAAGEPLASRTAPGLRHIARNAMRDDEMAAQGWAFAVESANLRERAARCVALAEAGGAVDLAQVDEVLRAFRSYDPFLADRDRALNDAARRRLVTAVGPVGSDRARRVG